MRDWSGIAAIKPDSIVFEPEDDPQLTYDPDTGRVTDQVNGDTFVVHQGHAGSGAQFILRSKSNKSLIVGAFRVIAVTTSLKYYGYEIVNIKSGPGLEPHISPLELSAERIAKFFRAWREGRVGLIDENIFVVDNRNFFKNQSR